MANVHQRSALLTLLLDPIARQWWWFGRRYHYLARRRRAHRRGLLRQGCR